MKYAKHDIRLHQYLHTMTNSLRSDMGEFFDEYLPKLESHHATVCEAIKDELRWEEVSARYITFMKELKPKLFSVVVKHVTGPPCRCHLCKNCMIATSIGIKRDEAAFFVERIEQLA